MRNSNEILYVLLAELLIIAPNCAHIALSSFITHPIRKPLCIISSLFLIIDSFFLLLTVFKDPGRLPRNFTTVDSPVVIQIKDQTFTMKPCITCKSLKDLRTHHCKICDYCVDRLDHHCPWVANCIGKRNHREFILLLISATINTLYMLIANSVEMTILHPPPGDFGGEIILVIYSIVFGWSVGSLLGYQLFLVGNNMTTHEHRRKLFSKNPFHVSFWRNCLSFWKMEKINGIIVNGDNKC